MIIKKILQKKSKKEYEDALWLLSSLLRKNRGEILLHSANALDVKELKQWKVYWKKRKHGVPLQYIVGKAPFYGEEFFVNQDVLIPRPETEILIDRCLGKFSNQKNLNVLDIGTGSGILAITLKLHRPSWNVYASDLSKSALNIAQKNAEEKNCKLSFFLMSGLDVKKFSHSIDVVISNPPYLNKKADSVTREVLVHEPLMALFPQSKPKNTWTEDQGVWIADQLIGECIQKRVRFLLMELSPRVAHKLKQHWQKNSQIRRIERFADLTGRERFLDIEFNHGQI